MPRIIFNSHDFECRENENLLDSFFRNKIEIPFSCRNGTCHACITRVVSGDIPKESQKGLSSSLIQSNHILPCKCYPQSDLILKTPTEADIYCNATLSQIHKLSKNIIQVSFKPDQVTKPFKTGQFINIKTHLDNKVRSYSLTESYSGADSELTIHVKLLPQGVFSQWSSSIEKTGQRVKIHYPLGATYNSEDMDVKGKLFIATGSGLGAVLAIIKQVVESGYRNEIILIYRVWNRDDFYLQDQMNSLELNNDNLQISSEVIKSVEDMDMALDNLSDMSEWEVVMYGNPDIVRYSESVLLKKGCKPENIHSDAFEYAAIPEYYRSDDEINKMEFVEEEKRKFEPDLSMWEALDNGRLLNEILYHFYEKVLNDELLSPFFKGVTKEHIIGKQYAFLNQIYTGKDCYFGDRPRNAHHWMIISDKLFDYREKLFKESCVKFGLQNPWLEEMLSLNESYRNVIVKTRMWPRIDKGEVKQIKGYEEMVLDIGCLCDGCTKELHPGDKVHYHALTGEMFCSECLNIKGGE